MMTIAEVDDEKLEGSMNKVQVGYKGYMTDMVLPRKLYTLDLQWPLSGVHSIMMEKSA